MPQDHWALSPDERPTERPTCLGVKARRAPHAGEVFASVDAAALAASRRRQLRPRLYQQRKRRIARDPLDLPLVLWHPELTGVEAGGPRRDDQRGLVEQRDERTWR